MSKLLIQEPPLQVLPTLAKEIGLEEAIFVQQLHYWLENAKIGKEIDGHKWISNTYSEWITDNFPFWTEDKLRRIVKGLEESGIVISAQLDKQSWERRKFYRIEYSKIAGSIAAKQPVLNKNPETTSDITPKNLQSITEQANVKVDAILDLEKQAVGKITYPKREALPEPIRELIDAWVRETGIKPLAREASGWLMEGQNWLNLNASAQDVVDAYRYAVANYPAPPMAPFGLTNTLRALKAGALKIKKEEEQGHWL